MDPALGRFVALMLLVVLSVPVSATGQTRPDAVLTSVGGAGKSALVVAGVTAAAVLIGVGIYFGIRQAHMAKGCVSSGLNGLILQKDGGQSPLVLLGSISHISAGERVRVRGSKKKSVPGVSNQPSFLVEKLEKDYGPCAVSTARP